MLYQPVRSLRKARRRWVRLREMACPPWGIMNLPLTTLRMLACAAALLGTTGMVRAETRLLRFPDIHGDRVAFTYGGDIWTAPAGGGVATHITTHPGLELFPKFSPDGQ